MLFSLSVLATLLTVPGSATAEPEATPRFRRARSQDRVPGQYIVILRDDTSSDAVPAVASELASRHSGSVRVLLQHAARGFTANLTEAQAERLSQDPRVLFVEENAKGYLSSQQGPLPGDLWHLDRIDQRPAVTMGDDYYYYCEKASGVIAYVLDTGIARDHQEFLLPGGNSRVLNGVKFAYDHHVRWSEGETDDYGSLPCGRWINAATTAAGHGTAVASIIGGKTVGVAKEVRLVPLRVYACYGEGNIEITTVEHMCWALDWIKSYANPYRNLKPALVNISQRVATSNEYAGALEHVINGLVLDSYDWTGITVIASANNQGTSVPCSTPARMAYRNDTYVHPNGFASPGRVISVGAIQENDTRWRSQGIEEYFEPGCSGSASASSNYGYIVDIYAPGHNLRVADLGVPGQGFEYRTDPRYKSGTSFAAAVVSGLAARLLQTDPTLRPIDVLNYIVATASNAGFDIDPDPASYNPMIAYRGYQPVCTPEFP